MQKTKQIPVRNKGNCNPQKVYNHSYIVPGGEGLWEWVGDEPAGINMEGVGGREGQQTQDSLLLAAN